MIAVEPAWIFDPLHRSINEIRYGAFIRQDRGAPALGFSTANQAMDTIRQITLDPLPSLEISAVRDIIVRLHRILIIREYDPQALNVRLSRLSICDVPEANPADQSTNPSSSSPVEEEQADPHNDEGSGDGTNDSSGSEREND
ncbi:Hypothetical predicted protein [Cloeon dipterum]|uniref:Uncharacterized protein n=1 Tax=Cloeon dipterum TaxID=197152 RepID=A0A8S1DSV9_9INSE|nr:Hypothetical predicted protein [Cloeon dipterum]